MQQYAVVYLLHTSSTCFGCLSHPSSGVHQTVTADSGTGHSNRATTLCQRGKRSLPNRLKRSSNIKTSKAKCIERTQPYGTTKHGD